MVKLLFFIGMYLYMGSLVCFEVSPRVKDCNIVASKRCNKVGLALFSCAIIMLVLFCIIAI